MHKLLFSGQLLPDHDPVRARAKLLAMLGATESQSDLLFSGQPQIIKRNLPADEAERYRLLLAKRGIVVEIDPPLPAPAAFPTLVFDDTPEPVSPAVLPRQAPVNPKPAPAILSPEHEQITCPQCGELQPKRTLCRACATDMPRFLAARLEAEAPVRLVPKVQPIAGRSGYDGRRFPKMTGVIVLALVALFVFGAIPNPVRSSGERAGAGNPVAVTETAASDVIVYTTTTCGACKEAKRYLQQRGIDFDERNVEEDTDYLREFNALGGRGVPFLIVHGKTMLGFDAERFETLFAGGD